MLARVAGAEISEDQAFSHLLLRGLRTSDVTDALRGDSPVTFESNLAAEIVVTRDEDDGRVSQIAALFESDAGYLVASQRAATILEFASVPMIYTRESGRFDIVSAQLQFQETGGVFSGSLQPMVKEGRRVWRLAYSPTLSPCHSTRTAIAPNLTARGCQRVGGTLCR